MKIPYGYVQRWSTPLKKYANGMIRLTIVLILWSKLLLIVRKGWLERERMDLKRVYVGMYWRTNGWQSKFASWRKLVANRNWVIAWMNTQLLFCTPFVMKIRPLSCKHQWQEKWYAIITLLAFAGGAKNHPSHAHAYGMLRFSIMLIQLTSGK